jgi:hypothetical protein
VGYRVSAVALILVAALTDAAGIHGLAFYALLAAVPPCALAALAPVGTLLERPNEIGTLQALLWGLCLAFVVVGAAARSPALETGAVPTLAVSMLRAALVVLGVKGSLAAWALVRPRVARAPQARATRA